MTKVIEFIKPDGETVYSVVAPNGIKPFGGFKKYAIQMASLSATEQLEYVGHLSLNQYKTHMGYRIKSTFLVKSK